VDSQLALRPASSGSSGARRSLFDLGSPSTLQLAPPNIPGAWIYSTQLVDKQGHGLTDQFLRRACPGLGAGSGGGGSIGTSHRPAPASAQTALNECAAKVAGRFHELVTYQPASRYWTFQWYELAIFLGAALALAWFCLWWARRRIC
jgi:hypothetical protein